MASKHIGMVEVYKEGVFGCVSASTGRPETPSSGWNKLEVADRAQIVPVGDLVRADFGGSRSGGGSRPGELSTFGGYVRRPAKLTLSTPWRGPASGNPALVALLETCLDPISTPATATDAVVAPSAVDGYMTSHGDRYATGALIGVAESGRNRYWPALNVSGGKVYFGVQPESALTVGQSVRLPHCFALPGDGFPTGGSVALRLTGHGWTAIAFGAYVTKITLSMDETTRAMRATLEIDASHVELAEGGSPSAFPIPTGASALQLGAYAYASAGRAVSEYFSAQADFEALNLESQSLEITFTRATPGTGETLVARSGCEIVDAQVSLSLTLGGPTAEFNSDVETQVLRQVLVGFGGGSTLSEGNGGGFYLPGAFVSNDPQKRDVSKDYLRTALTLGAARTATSGGLVLPLVVLGLGA